MNYHHNKMRSIRVLFLGDGRHLLDGVGKSSLISTLLSQNFPRSVQKTIPPLLIPQDFCLPTMNTETHLLDTSSAPQDQQFTNEQIERADIAIVIYDVNNPDSIKRVTSFWLPRVTRINQKIPIIIVGNKIDLRMNSDNVQRLESFLSPICKQYKQVQMGLQCSAKSYLNIIQVVYSAQIAVLFPISPIFQSSTKTLTENFKRALKRVFRICDKDSDGYLSDIELKQFEQEIFQKEMSSDHLHRVKQIIHAYQQKKEHQRSHQRANMAAAGSSGGSGNNQELKFQQHYPRGAIGAAAAGLHNNNNNNRKNGINFEQFLCLQEIMIVKRKSQTCWAILRHFGYTDDLKIKQQYFEDLSRQIDDWESVELSSLAVSYLVRLFEIYGIDTTKGKLLPESGVVQIFSTTRKGIPWNIKRTCRYISNEGRNNIHPSFIRDQYFLDLTMWIGLWQMHIYKDYRGVFKYLFYIGFMGKLKDAIQIRRQKIRQLASTVNRNVYQCYVIGALRTGKTCLLQAFIGYPFQQDTINTTSQHSVVNFTELNRRNYVEKKYLILTEIPEHQTDNFLKLQRNFKQGDVVCLVYYDQKTFAFVQEVVKWLPQFIPRILVKTKCDDPSIDLQANKTLDEHAAIIGSRQFCHISSKSRKFYNLIQKIIETSITPSIGLSRGVVKSYKQTNHKMIIGLFLGLGISFSGIFFMFKYNWIKRLINKIKT